MCCRHNITASFFSLKVIGFRLIEKLTKAGNYEEMIASETAKLDSEYHAKQLAVEKEATAALEEEHLKSQMGLRQKQLMEVANVVALYTDKETLDRLKDSTGKSQEDELLEVVGIIHAAFSLHLIICPAVQEPN